MGVPQPGFPFDSANLTFCPYRRKGRALAKADRRESGPIARQLLATAVTEFDRIVFILRDDFGFPVSDTFARRMLEQWIDSQGFLYVGAHPRNLPWMVAYFGPAQNLYGQRIGLNSALRDSISTMVPQARLSESGRVEKGRVWFRIDLQCLHHRVRIDADKTLTESLTLRVQDFTATNDPGIAPTIYCKEIVFSPDRFEALTHTPRDRARRNEGLLRIARDLAEKKGINLDGD